MEITIEFLEKLIFEGDLTPKLFLLMWFLIFLLLCGVTYFDEKNNKKEYKYYKNNIHSQWRKFK